eukprot:Em0001g2613a
MQEAMEVVGIEQFLSTLPEDKAIWSDFRWNNSGYPLSAEELCGAGSSDTSAWFPEKKEMLNRILRRFYWPSIIKDVVKYCRSCVQCQKFFARKMPLAPLNPLPVISEPFSRIVQWTSSDHCPETRPR